MGADLWKKGAAVTGVAALVVVCCALSQRGFGSSSSEVSLLKFQLGERRLNDLEGYNSKSAHLHSLKARAAFGAMEALEKEAKHINTPTAIRHASTKMDLAFGKLKAIEKYSQQLLHEGSKKARAEHIKLQSARLREPVQPGEAQGRWQRTTVEYKGPARTSSLAEVPGIKEPVTTKDMRESRPAMKGTRSSSRSASSSLWKMQRNLPP